jgi:hypothetical protein
VESASAGEFRSHVSRRPQTFKYIRARSQHRKWHRLLP